MKRVSHRANCRRRGQATTETVMAVLVLSLIFFGLLQVAYLYVAQFITSHTAFVTARSHAVGFHPAIVARATEVGSIGMAGKVVGPQVLVGLTPLEQAALEPMLIQQHIQTLDGYVLNYQYWENIWTWLPLLNENGMTRAWVGVYNYPVEMPMHQAYYAKDQIDIYGSAWYLNHAAYYLQ